MRTCRFYKYLMAMIIALGTSVNVFAQQRNLKIYFNQYVKGATGAPSIKVTDDNEAYGVPLGLEVSANGVAWANSARFFEWISQDVTDRLVADYVIKNNQPDKKHSNMKLTFTDFPYEVNGIQWNAMNDLLSGSLYNFFSNYQVTTKCVPYSGNGFSYTKESWALNPFAHQTGFTKSSIPWKEDAVLNGLKSFEISEAFVNKLGFFNWTILNLGNAELSEKVRTFIKAGWNGKSGSESNITDSDDSYWAFKVTFTLPDISSRTYDIATGNVDNNINKGENKKHKLRGYISDHAGAVESLLTYDPNPNRDDFHFEYIADRNKINIGQYTGVINSVYATGDITVTIKLMRGSNEVRSIDQTIHVLEQNTDPTINVPEIAIAFANGNKGYDITVGDQNAQISGIITKYGEGLTLSNNATGYHFEYSEDSNGEIIDINKLTGKITAKKEGDVYVSAVLKNGNTVASNIYTYKLHVFAQHEGLEWNRLRTWYYNTSNADATNTPLWRIDFTDTYKDDYNSETNWPFNWKKEKNLKTSMNVQTTSDWKQITGFNTSAYVDEQNRGRWRAICQKVGLDVKVPKYSKASFAYTLAGNVASQEGRHYGFEVKDVGVVSSDEANKRIYAVKWITTDNSAGHSSELGKNTYSNSTVPTVLVGGVGSASVNNVAANVGMSQWDIDNKENANPASQTRYLAVMSYLGRESIDFGTASFGYKNIPTYTYYSTVTYYTNDVTGNDGRGDVWETQNFTSTSKTETMQMYNGSHTLPTRAGYEFLGWSTDPNATTAEYQGKGDSFCPYDAENGGGKGPVYLYAVWRPIPYIVTLSHNGGSGKTEEIVAYYGQPMPEDESIVAPTRTGYDFTGYRTQKDITPQVFYYDAEMKSAHIYDKTSDYTIFANWEAHTTTVVFDLQGGILYYGATEVNATYGKDMPTEGVGVPQRQGYTFGGYYNKPNGAGTQYYTASMTSARTWNIDERLLNPQVTKVTLYANWIPLTYTVTLDPQGGTGGTTSVTATYGQKLPSGLIAPTKVGYEFKGYYSNQNQEYAESMGQDYGGTQYYDKDMNGVEPWDKTEGGTIYAHWAPKTYIVTFDLGDESHAAIFPDNVVSANKDRIMEITSDGKMKVSFDYGISGDNSIDLSVPKKPGYEMLGWYDANGDLIVTVDSKDRHAYITDKNNYWQKDGNNVKWNYADDLVLTAKFRCKYTVEDAGNGPIIKFDNEIVEPDQDWLSSVISDLQGAAKEVGTPENPVMAFDLRTSKNIWTGNKFARLNVMESLQSEEYKDYISPNVLVYFNDNESEAWYIDGTNPEYQGRNDADCYNAVSLDNKCRNLVVTDRYRIKIPYAFDAQHASYARDANVASGDAAKDQAKNSTWGTLCLPYPIKNDNRNGVKFYELQSTANNYMEFEEMAQDEVIPANTPVLYIRTDGGVSSMITIKEQNVGVPMNANYTAVNKSYSNADESIRDWEFRGNLKTTVFYGKGYVNPPAGAQILDGDVYYFKQDKFTYLNPKMEKNGKTYQAAKMTLYPYRAYFYRNTKGSYYSSAKVSEYSILVIGEDGATLDITNEIFGDGEGDGKIYDLNGIRVMKPVKGRLYIVNGQKKVYK